MRSWERTDRPVILAHRGGADEYPENSLESFEKMRELGFTYIETDTHATVDGELVIIHDPTLERTTDGFGPIAEATWAEVERLTDRSGRRPMLLREALDLFPDLDFNVDLKSDATVEPMIRLMREGDYLDRVLLASFSERRLSAMRAAIPGVATSVGTAAVAALVLAARAPRPIREVMSARIAATGFACVQMPETYRGVPILDTRLVDLVHGMGAALHVWTVNEAMNMTRLLDLGVDGLVTDRPTLAREVIELRG